MKKRIYAPALLAVLVILASVTQGAPSMLRTGEKLSLALEDAALPTVMNMIAQQYSLNLVLSGEVTGSVTLRLENVDIETALEAILYPSGYNYYLKDDVIVVKPIDFNAVGELVSEVVTLKYVTPNAAQAALESIKSPKGKIVILDKSEQPGGGGADQTYKPNKLILTDYPSVVTKMLELVEQMDIADRLISIEVKIIETNVDSQKKLGLSWPTTMTSTFGYGTYSSTKTTETSSETIDMENLAGTWNPNTGSWTWGLMSVDQVTAVLNMLEQNGNSKLISDPHVTTLENHRAEIAVETVIPIPTVTRFTEGAATQDIQTFYDEEVGVSVVVTPRINEEGRITMEVVPTIEDIIGYTGSTEAQKPITISRRIKTFITVDDGQTAALGGLLKENVIKTKQKVPVLGSIPLLGGLLFTSTSEEKETSDLIIMITPRIIQ